MRKYKGLMHFKLLFISCILFTGNLFAQKFTTSVDAQLSVPQQDYSKASADAGFGIRANFLYKPAPNVPVKFGIELGMQEKGRSSQYFSGYVYGLYDEFQVTATNNIFSVMFITRFQSSGFHKIKPFVDLMAGWNAFFSTVDVERVTYYSQYNSGYSNSSNAKWAFAFGPAAGVDIPLNKYDDLGLEIKLAYLFGGHTKYLTDPYIDNNANASFVEKESRTDMLIPQAGIRITIK
jgi:hypothetical protein